MNNKKKKTIFDGGLQGSVSWLYHTANIFYSTALWYDKRNNSYDKLNMP